jgi:hypothetical protein
MSAAIIYGTIEERQARLIALREVGDSILAITMAMEDEHNLPENFFEELTCVVPMAVEETIFGEFLPGDDKRSDIVFDIAYGHPVSDWLIDNVCVLRTFDSPEFWEQYERQKLMSEAEGCHCFP